MKRFWLGIAAVSAVSACGGDGTNPFSPAPEVVEPDGISEELAGDLAGYSYDPATQTLTVTGVGLDTAPIEGNYRRRPGLDRNGFQAFTAQDGPLTRHSTAYVKTIEGVSSAVVLTGGQFDRVIGGTAYGRSGRYDPPSTTGPDAGIVTYAGKYVGLLNAAGDGGDLRPVKPGIPDDARPRQAAEVTGSVYINADFSDNRVDGGIIDRTLVDRGVALTSVDLTVTDITQDGTFEGQASQANSPRGTYGGVFGGEDAGVVAGSVFVENHIDGIDNELEYGAFVLQNCGPGNADPNCP